MFLREIVYCKYFSDDYHLPKAYSANNRAIQWLEIPLDSHVAMGLQEDDPMLPLQWKSIKQLTPEENEIYQQSALKIARQAKTAKIHLDMKYWRKVEIMNFSFQKFEIRF